MTPFRRAAPWIVAVATLLAFLPALGGQFLNWDDDKNFLENPSYRGLAPENLKWMATTFLMGHYHPLTWLTLGLDYTIWGMAPFGYHLTSLLLHAAGAVLLYAVLLAFLRLSGRPDLRWPAVVGALLYAVHPLRVESVAWITERRDVTCGVFALLTVLFYLRRAEEERAGRDARRWLVLSLAAFAASLLSKALGIMLPAVLLLLDVHPLGRFRPGNRARILREKIPYLLLSAADGAVMLFAMRHIDSVHSAVTFHLPARLAQAAYGICFYLVKAVWPSGLAPLYRLDPGISPTAPLYLGAILAVTAVTALLLVRRRQAPGPLTAWLAYLLLLLPVLGLAVTGRQIAADRYSYLALLPITILAVFGLARLDATPRRTPAIAASTAAVVLLGMLTWRQSGYWKDSLTLWNREIALDPHCAIAYENRGAQHAARGDLGAALADYDTSITLDPSDPIPWYNRGALKAIQGRHDEAIADFTGALDRDPGQVKALSGRAVSRAERRDREGALADADAALRLDPASGAALADRGLVRFKLGDLPGAIADYGRSLDLAPGVPQTWSNRALAESRLGRLQEARRDLDRALDLRPDHAPTLAERATVRTLAGDLKGALEDFSRSLSLKPDPSTYLRRATARGIQGDLDGAVSDLDEAVRLNPGYADAYARRGMAKLGQKRNGEAAVDLQKALELYPPGAPQRPGVEEALRRARVP